MFWLPILVIILLIYGVYALIRSIKTAQYDAMWRNHTRREEALKTATDDPNLEEILRDQINRKMRLDDWKRTVQEFMGGAPEWSDYVDYMDGKQKTLLVLMAQQGKIPSDFIGNGRHLQFSDSTLHDLRLGDHRILPQRGREMNEEFVMRIADYLNREFGIHAVACCYADVPDQKTFNGKRTEWGTVEELRRKYGPGITHYFTRFSFTMGNAQKG